MHTKCEIFKALIEAALSSKEEEVFFYGSMINNNQYSKQKSLSGIAVEVLLL